MRAVPTFAPGAAALARLRAGWAGGTGAGDLRDLVFLDPRGRPLDGRAVLKAWHAAALAAGLPPIRFHDSRRLAITRWALSGVPLKVAATWAGHASIQETADVYAAAGVIDSMQFAGLVRF